MSKNTLGQELIQAANEALKAERGKKKVRETIVEVKPAPKWTKTRIIRLRKDKFGVSQAIFASYLNVSKKSVESWEQGINSPSGSASRLLQFLDDTPEEIVEKVVGGN